MLIDVSEEHTLVRFTIGDFEEPFEIPSSMVDYAISQQDATAKQTYRVWKASLQCLYWMKAKYAAQGSHRREKIGGREVEEYRREKLLSITDLITWLEDNPGGAGQGMALPIFTGTTVAERDALDNDPRFVKPRIKSNWFYREYGNLQGTNYWELDDDDNDLH